MAKICPTNIKFYQAKFAICYRNCGFGKNDPFSARLAAFMQNENFYAYCPPTVWHIFEKFPRAVSEINYF